MNTRMQFDMMEKALPYAAELMDCQEIHDFKKAMREAEDAGNGDMMRGLLPIFLREKRETVFGLLGAISGKTAEEIAEQEWEETRKLLESPILSDLYDFFIFSVRTARNA